MQWRGRRRRGAGLDRLAPTIAHEPPSDVDLLERAPGPVMVITVGLQVVRANGAARVLFGAGARHLPESLVEFTREARLEQAVRSRSLGGDLRLARSGRVVRAHLVDGAAHGDLILFLEDVSDLRRLETVRQEFVANLSHELKTPITSLRLAAESLLGNPPDEARRQFADRVVRDADHLVAIVDNLRQLAEMEAGGLHLRLHPFDVRDMVVEVAGRLDLEDRLQLNIPGALEVTADRDKLAQALGNLLDNAAKFAPTGSPIEVDVEVSGSEMILRIRDRGTGISPEHWDRVFERFYKVDPARSRSVAGSGLGLAITKHLILAHGGRVWTEAHRDGGQVFGIALPAAALAGP